MTKKKEKFMQLSNDTTIAFDVKNESLYEYIKLHTKEIKKFVESEDGKSITEYQRMKLIFYGHQLEQSIEGLYFS